jgi:hypothetical protein
MRKSAWFVAVPAVLGLGLAALPAQAQQSKLPQASPPSLDTLLQQFEAQAQAAPGGVRLDAWIETSDAGKEMVVVVAPEGETKLVADPGITVTPASRPGVQWQLPLPHRMVDAERDYFDPPAMVRLPFTSDDDQPVQLLVEYAYCFVDFQCFFGEEELTVAVATP